MAEGLKGDVKLKLKLAYDVPRGTADCLQTANEIIRQPEMPRGLFIVGSKASGKRPEHSAAAPLEYLHVFTLVSKSSESTGDAVLQDLQGQLSAAEKFLTEKTSYSAQRGYKRCGLMTRDGLHEYLEKLAARVDEKKSDTARRSYDDSLAVFNMADMLFQTFFPLTFHGLPTTGKYWGALSKLLKVRLFMMALIA